MQAGEKNGNDQKNKQSGGQPAKQEDGVMPYLLGVEHLTDSALLQHRQMGVHDQAQEADQLFSQLGDVSPFHELRIHK
ncbi:hypothetical protein D3C75_1345940 [compost metagenome]